MLSDCRCPRFRNLNYSTVPVDVVRVKSYMNSLFLKLCESLLCNTGFPAK